MINVKKLRRDFGLRFCGRELSQKELGTMLGLTGPEPDRTVRRWEKGTHEPSGPVQRLLKLLQCFVEMPQIKAKQIMHKAEIELPS